MRTVNLWVSALVLCSLCTMAMTQDTLSYQGNLDAASAGERQLSHGV